MLQLSIPRVFQRPNVSLESQYVTRRVLKDNLSYECAITGIEIGLGY